MVDLLVYIWASFCKPFKSRLFIIFFFLFFVPLGPFGIYYQWFNNKGDKGFWDYFTPESIFTFTAPLMAAIIIDGLIIAISEQKNLEHNSVEFELFRDSIILAAIIMLIQCLLIFSSISHNSLILSAISVVILWIFWIIISSAKNEFSPHKRWRPTGTADDTSSEAISNE
ncbi:MULTISPECIES: hypothetical protein [Pseudoalteromonas]|uniref:hypothetical protein n=1 Tax=Pseudoalteromonas TaxID=53246 RepID=UPI000B7708BB|nr:hypothetical protein [Pseudoalteromonas espejiana]